jgi:CRP-like cAMP-binding protein
MSAGRPSIQLHEVPLFAGVSREEIKVVLDACVMQTFLAGDEIFSEGDPGSEMWIVEAGNVEAFCTLRGGADKVLGEFHPGSIFGEMGFLDGSRRSAGARATMPTHVSMLTRAAFDKVATDHPRVAAIFYSGLAKVMAERLRETSAHLTQSIADYMEVTGASALTLHRLVEDLRVVTIHFGGGAQVRGTFLALHHQPQGWTVVIKDEKDRVSIVPYTSIARIEVG